MRGCQRFEDGFELTPRALVAVAMEAHRILADGLDEVEDILSLLFAHRVAKDTAEEADIVFERAIGFAVRGKLGPGGFLVHRSLPSFPWFWPHL